MVAMICRNNRKGGGVLRRGGRVGNRFQTQHMRFGEQETVPLVDHAFAHVTPAIFAISSFHGV